MAAASAPSARSRHVRLSTTSADGTFALGTSLAAAARPGDVIALWGDLGAGKTVFAKGFGAGLGVVGTITSPSFILMAEYPGRFRLFHVDLYRLGDAAEAVGGGLLDERQVAGVTLIEWPDRLGEALPGERLDVRIAGAGDAERSIELEARSAELERYVVAASAKPATPASPTLPAAPAPPAASTAPAGTRDSER